MPYVMHFVSFGYVCVCLAGKLSKLKEILFSFHIVYIHHRYTIIFATEKLVLYK